MRFGLSVWPVSPGIDIAVLSKRAEELGFESIWFTEHYLPVQQANPIDGGYQYLVDPFVAMGRATAVTSTIRLGSGCCLAAFRHPVALAKLTATVDAYSNGRYIFGVGGGRVPEEAAMFGVDYEHRWGIVSEHVRAVRELWTNDAAAFDGKYVSFPLTRVYPKPVQKPHPPIYLAGNHPNVLRRVAAWGDGWMPSGLSPERLRQGRETLDHLLAERGRDLRSIEVTLYPLWPRDFDQIPAFEDAGADRIAVRVTPGPEDAVLRELDEAVVNLRQYGLGG